MPDIHYEITQRPEDYLLLKNEEIEKIEYEYNRPASLSYNNIEETRSYRSQSSINETPEVHLLWRQKEFRASLYEGDKKRGHVEPAASRRETDPIMRRSSTIRDDHSPPGHVTTHYQHSEIFELKRSYGELSQSNLWLTSDTTDSVYEHHLFRLKDLPYNDVSVCNKFSYNRISI